MGVSAQPPTRGLLQPPPAAEFKVQLGWAGAWTASPGLCHEACSWKSTKIRMCCFFFFGVCVDMAYNPSPAATLCRVVGASVEADSIWDLLFFKPKIRHSGCSRGTGVGKRRKCDKGTILERYIMDHNGGFLWHLLNFHFWWLPESIQTEQSWNILQNDLELPCGKACRNLATEVRWIPACLPSWWLGYLRHMGTWWFNQYALGI